MYHADQFAPYTPITFVHSEVITSSINEHGYVLYGNRPVIQVFAGKSIFDEEPIYWDDDFDLDAL